MHLPLARLVSMSVIFCILPNSSIVILLFFYISEQHVCKLWVWIQFTGLTFPLWGTPVNNRITLIYPVQWGSIFCRWQSMRSFANFLTVFSASQNANPFDVELEPDFNAKWPFKVTRFRDNVEPLRGYIVHCNNCGHECEGSEDIASERNENRHLRRPHTHLTPPLQQTPANIQINLTLLESSLGYNYVADSV